MSKCIMCPRGCDLSNPSCSRGVNYAKSLGLDVQSEAAQTSGHDHQKSGHNFLRFSDENKQRVMKYLHHAVRAADEWGLGQEQAEQMFEVLDEKETEQLADLLEKLSNHWMHIAPNKPERSSHHHSH